MTTETAHQQPSAAEASQQKPPAGHPPYVAVPSITDPKLVEIPQLHQFMVLVPGEQAIKAYRIRIRRPKFPWILLLVSLIPLPFAVYGVFRIYDYQRDDYYWENRGREEYSPDAPYDYGAPGPGESYPGDFGAPSEFDESFPGDFGPRDPEPFDEKMLEDDYPPLDPSDYFEKSPEANLFEGGLDQLVAPPVERTIDGFVQLLPQRRAVAFAWVQYEKGDEKGYDDGRYDEKGYDEKGYDEKGYDGYEKGYDDFGRESGAFDSGEGLSAYDGPPGFPWAVLAGSLLFWSLPATLVIVLFYLLRMRGHTFLYLTNQRLVVVELEQGVLGRRQTLMNYRTENIAGFTLHAQRGLRRLFNLILLKEKRTFYLAVITRTLAQFEVGAVNTRRSKYEPGQDAVSLCAELDAQVLGIKSQLPRAT